MWTRRKEKADPATVAADYVQAAYEFADRTFGAIDHEVLADFAAAAHKVAAAVESGHHQLVDGYKQYEVPSEPGARGVPRVHLDARTAWLRAHRRRQRGRTQRGRGLLPPGPDRSFKCTATSRRRRPSITPELQAKKVRAEELTSAMMAECFSVLSDHERQHLADGAIAMYAALKEPVAVA